MQDSTIATLWGPVEAQEMSQNSLAELKTTKCTLCRRECEVITRDVGPTTTETGVRWVDMQDVSDCCHAETTTTMPNLYPTWEIDRRDGVIYIWPDDSGDNAIEVRGPDREEIAEFICNARNKR